MILDNKPHQNLLKTKYYELLAFKRYFDELYGQGLEISNWHLNGELEPFDNFYESALENAVKVTTQMSVPNIRKDIK